MGYFLIRYDKPNQFLEQSKNMDSEVFLKASVDLYGKLWFSTLEQGTIVVHEYFATMKEINQQLDELDVKPIRGEYEYIK